jgi:hypothetical protein
VTTLFEDTTEFAAFNDDLGAWNSSSSQFCAESRGSDHAFACSRGAADKRSRESGLRTAPSPA